MATSDTNNVIEPLSIHFEIQEMKQIEETEIDINVKDKLLNPDEMENKYEEDTTLNTKRKRKNTNPLLKRQETLNTQLQNDQLMMSEQLQLPYKKKCHSMVQYWFKSLIVTHPRLYSLFLLYRSIWPRLLGMSVVHILYFVYDINCCYV